MELTPREKDKLLLFTASLLAERRRAWTARRNGYQSGTLWKYAQTVGDAENGAVTHPGARAETHVYADI